jgi:hypothetical protein
MRKRLVVPSAVLLALLLGPFALEYAQNAPTGSGDSDHAKQSLAVNLLRAINTAEVSYRHNHGEYAPWAILLDSPEFPYGDGIRFVERNDVQWAPRTNPQLANLHLSRGPEILQGWMLRLDLTEDGKGYDVLLEDTTDKTCGYAVLTDERGVIRQSKAIDCQI